MNEIRKPSALEGMQSFRRVLERIHRVSAWLLLFGIAGIGVELLLLHHTDGWWQLAPLALLGIGVLALLGYTLRRNLTTIRLLQTTMLLFVASGVAGTVLHFQGNITYESESNPGLSGRALYEAAVQGSTPTLAPGVMIQLGLAGLLLVFCGTALDSQRSSTDVKQSTELRT